MSLFDSASYPLVVTKGAYGRLQLDRAPDGYHVADDAGMVAGPFKSPSQAAKHAYAVREGFLGVDALRAARGKPGIPGIGGAAWWGLKAQKRPAPETRRKAATPPPPVMPATWHETPPPPPPPAPLPPAAPEDYATRYALPLAPVVGEQLPLPLPLPLVARPVQGATA